MIPQIEIVPPRSRLGIKPGSISMADFLQRIAERGDVEAFRKLFQSYAPRVKSYMMRQGADANTAEELTQETMMTVWRKASLYSVEKGSATTWIYTIARNLRIDRLRKEIAWVALPEGYDQQESPDALPDDVMSEQERKKRVQDALAVFSGALTLFSPIQIAFNLPIFLNELVLAGWLLIKGFTITATTTPQGTPLPTTTASL